MEQLEGLRGGARELLEQSGYQFLDEEFRGGATSVRSVSCTSAVAWARASECHGGELLPPCAVRETATATSFIRDLHKPRGGVRVHLPLIVSLRKMRR